MKVDSSSTGLSRRKKNNFLPNLFMVLVYFFLYAPLLVMIFFSFNSGKSTSVFSGFSFRWYEDLFSGGGQIIECLRNSLILAILSSVISTVLGTLGAVGIYKLGNRKSSSVLLSVNSIPMMNPDIVTGVSLMMMFVFLGTFLHIVGDKVNFYTLLIAHITFNIPYVILNVLPKLKSTDKNLMEAAQDLGCAPVPAFFKVVLPQLYTAIASGFLMAFTLSFDDFVISYYTSGVDFMTLPVYIYSLVKKTVKPNIYALYSIILAAIILLLVMYNILQNQTNKNKGRKKAK